MEHGAPIPNGAVVGNMIFSSAISGKDAKIGMLSPDADQQAEAMFRNLRQFMESVGGTPIIGYMKVYLKKKSTAKRSTGPGSKCSPTSTTGRRATPLKPNCAAKRCSKSKRLRFSNDIRRIPSWASK
jgi:hypothetical protein